MLESNKHSKEKEWNDTILKAQSGDKVSRDKFFCDNQGLIYMVAKRFLGRGYEMEELVQIGAMGLLKAIERFDVKSEYSFSTYAVPLIIGEIKRYLRDDSFIHISRSVKENARKIAMVREKYKLEENQDLSINELVKLTELSKEEVITAIDAYSQIESLDKPVGEGLFLQDKIVSNDNFQNDVICRLTVNKLLEDLEEQQSLLMKYRYIDNMTQVQAAELLGMNQVAVSRMEKKVLREMYCKIV